MLNRFKLTGKLTGQGAVNVKISLIATKEAIEIAKKSFLEDGYILSNEIMEPWTFELLPFKIAEPLKPDPFDPLNSIKQQE